MCFPIEKAVEFKWKFQGLQCVVTRIDLGRMTFSKHRCGYVRIPPGHPWHGMDYNDIPADVHGGLTFSEIEPCTHEDGTGYWIGFDCAHAGDANQLPEDPEPYPGYRWHGHYWTLPEVQTETEALAAQVLAAGKVAA